jgi:hypothetical protein
MFKKLYSGPQSGLQRLRLALLVPFLLILTGCQTLPPLVIEKRVRLPTELLQQCLHPELDLTTNGGLATGILNYQDALDRCNIDKAKIKELDAEP